MIKISTKINNNILTVGGKSFSITSSEDEVAFNKEIIRTIMELQKDIKSALKKAEQAIQIATAAASNSGSNTSASENTGAGAETPPTPDTPDVPTPAPHGELIDEITINATEAGEFVGYTLERLNKCIPDKETVHFYAELFCPPGTLLDTPMTISSFADGRLWSVTNQYCANPEIEKLADGTHYIMEWNEPIQVQEWIWDDDIVNKLATYYICTEFNCKKTDDNADLSACTLTIKAFYTK